MEPEIRKVNSTGLTQLGKDLSENCCRLEQVLAFSFIRCPFHCSKGSGRKASKPCVRDEVCGHARAVIAIGARARRTCRRHVTMETRLVCRRVA